MKPGLKKGHFKIGDIGESDDKIDILFPRVDFVEEQVCQGLC